MMFLRAAHPGDIKWLIEQLKLFDEFTALKRPIFPSLEYAWEKLAQLMHDDNCIFIVACQADQPVGFIVGYLAPHIFNPERTLLTEMFWWVQPEFRNSRAGLILLEAFISFGEMRASSTIMTLESKSQVKPETLLKRGFTEFERNFILEHHHGDRDNDAASLSADLQRSDDSSRSTQQAANAEGSRGPEHQGS